MKVQNQIQIITEQTENITRCWKVANFLWALRARARVWEREREREIPPHGLS